MYEELEYSIIVTFKNGQKYEISKDCIIESYIEKYREISDNLNSNGYFKWLIKTYDWKDVKENMIEELESDETMNAEWKNMKMKKDDEWKDTEIDMNDEIKYKPSQFSTSSKSITVASILKHFKKIYSSNDLKLISINYVKTSINNWKRLDLVYKNYTEERMNEEIQKIIYPFEHSAFFITVENMEMDIQRSCMVKFKDIYETQPKITFEDLNDYLYFKFQGHLINFIEIQIDGNWFGLEGHSRKEIMERYINHLEKIDGFMVERTNSEYYTIVDMEDLRRFIKDRK